MCCVLPVDVVKDEQPGGVVRPCKPGHNVLYYCVNVSVAVTSILPACLRDLALRDPIINGREDRWLQLSIPWKILNERLLIL
jgi:hypothetical protein